MRIPEGEREKGTEELFEPIMTENFPQININIKPRIHEAQK